jgi:hypothetical protein
MMSVMTHEHMTESEWMACTDAQRMLVFLQSAGLASDRRLRLFAFACCRRIWTLLPSEACREAVRAAERHLDGLATFEELRAWATAASEFEHPPVRGWREYGARAAYFAAWRTDVLMASVVAAEALLCGHWNRATEAAAQAGILRDLFGPAPFCPRSIESNVAVWNDRAIPRLADAIYDGRSFEQLPILADALEDAGCSDAALLDHCRGPGPHVRGCWVVDLLLGKE